MKIYFYLIPAIIFFPFHISAQFACSGLDRVDVYLNRKLVATATPAEVPTIKLDPFSKTDTIVLLPSAHADFVPDGGTTNVGVEINFMKGR